MNWTLLIMFTVVMLFTAGCSKPAVENVSAPAAPDPLTPAVVEQATQQGNNIVAETFQLLSSNLQNAIQQGGISNALPYCKIAALPLTRSASQSQGVAVRRFTHKPRNPQGKADPLELSVLKQFELALQLTNAPAALVTQVAPGQVSFFAPIILSNELCLKCHGEPGKDIALEHAALIDELYTEDQAKGFKLGQLRGAWRVDFPMAAFNQPAR